MFLTANTLSSSQSTSSWTVFTVTSTSFYSTYVDDTYNLTIAIPNDYNETTPYNYHTIYLLDAAYHFDGTYPYIGRDIGPGGMVGIIEELILTSHFPPCLLVGIDYAGDINTQRYRDFRNNRTPFYSFVKHELIPFIDARYRTNTTDRTLLGHSLGGTFTTYCLFQYNSSNPSLFKRFVTLSGNYRTDVFDALAAESVMYEGISKSTNISVDLAVFLAVGEQDDPLFVSGNKNLSTRLQSRNYKNFRFNGTIYQNYDHRTVIRPGFTEGLKWIFSDETWKTELTEQDIKQSSNSSDSLVHTTNYIDYGIITLLMVFLITKFKRSLSQKKRLDLIIHSLSNMYLNHR
jgi:predicted alpha/beta superfamily hydrolase